MSDNNWGSFSYWKQIYTDNDGGLESPFNPEPLTDKSVYFWSQMSAPLPSGSTSGAWGCFPEANLLTGFIRYIVFPAFFEIWLVREDWDKDPERFVNADELFALAEKSGKCSYIQDLPLMKALIAELDQLIDKPDKQIRNGLQRVANKFNGRWGDTSTWCFEIHVFNTPEEVGIEIMNRLSEDVYDEEIEEELGISKKDWMIICNSATSDSNANGRFVEILENNAWY